MKTRKVYLKYKVNQLGIILKSIDMADSPILFRLINLFSFKNIVFYNLFVKFLIFNDKFDGQLMPTLTGC